MDNKIALRTKAKSIRKTLDISSLSNSAVKIVRELDIYKTSKDVLIFYPMKFELNFLDLLEDNKNFYLPKVNGENLFVCPFDKKSKLEKSGFNVMEPCSEPVKPEVIDFAIVPALMADKNNYRLGYGGGFYDRFLSANPNIKTVVVLPEVLFVEELPVEDFDVKMDYILKV